MLPLSFLPVILSSAALGDPVPQLLETGRRTAGLSRHALCWIFTPHACYFILNLACNMLCIQRVALVCFPLALPVSCWQLPSRNKRQLPVWVNISLSHSLFPLLLLELMQHHFTDWVAGTDAKRGCCPWDAWACSASKICCQSLKLCSGSWIWLSSSQETISHCPAITLAQDISIAAIAHFTGFDVDALGKGEGLFNTT